jgi:hypothetical protein
MPVILSATDQQQYDRMVQLLHSLIYGLTTRFLQDPTSRTKILSKLGDCTWKMLTQFGCGDLCTDKEKGCVSCDYAASGSQSAIKKR